MIQRQRYFWINCFWWCCDAYNSSWGWTPIHVHAIRVRMLATGTRVRSPTTWLDYLTYDLLAIACPNQHQQHYGLTPSIIARAHDGLGVGGGKNQGQLQDDRQQAVAGKSRSPATFGTNRYLTTVLLGALHPLLRYEQKGRCTLPQPI